eukprot:TRINITY_DN3778_c0_g1_i11.p1 TRINITY_DN3778_c0_g1~~TRINITY_DN3778_c0_g1_i11.p1  ORF type:complete len:338 (+),score=42.79 TRINITY_DN3778_c0_g1_i11:63-1076(+)
MASPLPYNWPCTSMPVTPSVALVVPSHFSARYCRIIRRSSLLSQLPRSVNSVATHAKAIRRVQTGRPSLWVTAASLSTDTEAKDVSLDEPEPQSRVTPISESRQRRLKKARIERERKRAENPPPYPQWARVLEESSQDDAELKEILGDSVGDPEEMTRRLEARMKRKGKEILQPKSGSAVPMKVTFADFEPGDLNVWLELYAPPSEEAVEILGLAFRSWYVLGQLGAFNASSLQLHNAADPDAQYRYRVRDPESAEDTLLPSMLHNMGDLEFQDAVARIWVDLGTSDALALDLLVNALNSVSSDHVGIKSVTFGGPRHSEWEEGMTREEDGYILHKI